jgi:flagellar basal-body rod protein FlgB
MGVVCQLQIFCRQTPGVLGHKRSKATMPLISQLTTPTLKAISQSLDLRLQRHKQLVSNLANVNTPDYKAADFKFEKTLKQAMRKGNTLSILKTNAKHIGPANSLDEKVRGKLVASPTPGGRGDGNTVDIDYQMSKFMQNQLLYTASTKMVKGMFRGLTYAIDNAGGSGR